MAQNPYSGVHCGNLVGAKQIMAAEKGWQEGYDTAKTEDADLLAACEAALAFITERYPCPSMKDKLRAAIGKHKAKGE